MWAAPLDRRTASTKTSDKEAQTVGMVDSAQLGGTRNPECLESPCKASYLPGTKGNNGRIWGLLRNGYCT